MINVITLKPISNNALATATCCSNHRHSAVYRAYYFLNVFIAVVRNSTIGVSTYFKLITEYF